MNTVIQEKNFPPLTKIGTIILICSLVLSTFFVTLGIVIAVTDSSPKNFKTSTYTIYEGKTKTLSTSKYETYTFKFSPTSTERFLLETTGGKVTRIQSSNGSDLDFEFSSISSDTYTYSCYLVEDKTYTISVYANSTTLKFYVY